MRNEEALQVGSSSISIVTPAYREADNLPVLYERLRQVMDKCGIAWEWIVVDDHSPDATFAVIREIARQDERVSGVRLARNSGSHIAVTCGLHAAKGDCAITLGADLQDPPEVVPELLNGWYSGAHVVWAVRDRREGEPVTKKGAARIYYWIMRHIVGLKEMPAMGADFFLTDRRVLDALRSFSESNMSILALITWMGFRQTTITYTKESRLYGQSGWTLTKKIKMVVDSITSFSYVPIRTMSYLGFFIAFIGFIYAIVVVANAIFGAPPEGWSSLAVLVLVLGGGQMLMMGVLGEYIWRALDEARRRPRYLIEETIKSKIETS